MGINLFDHADIYGFDGAGGFGDAEALFGRALAEDPKLRARMIIAIVALSLAAGVYAYTGLPKEGEPDIEIPEFISIYQVCYSIRIFFCRMLDTKKMLNYVPDIRP